MTVQLGNIVLDDDLLLSGIETAPDIAVSTVVTLGGISDSSIMPLSGGRSLSLFGVKEGDSVTGVFLRSQVLEIKSMAAAGQIVPFIHHVGTFSVLIVSTAGLVPVYYYANPRPGDWYTGPVQLIEV